jgi:hypothetical protein
MRIAIIATCLLLASCASRDVQPQIVTKTAYVAVATPCSPKLPSRPKLMTKDDLAAATAAAINFDDKVKIVTEQLLAYIGWTPVVEAALTGCGTVPK